MSDLRPQHTKIILGGKEYGLLFTLRAIDEIQEHYDIPISKMFELLKTEDNVLDFIVSALSGGENPPPIEKDEIGMVLNKVIEAFFNGTPLNDNPNPPPSDEVEKLNVARFLFIGKTLLGYPEEEVWNMTLRKLILLFEEYQKANGIYHKPETLDDLIPGE